MCVRVCCAFGDGGRLILKLQILLLWENCFVLTAVFPTNPCQPKCVCLWEGEGGGGVGGQSRLQ